MARQSAVADRRKPRRGGRIGLVAAALIASTASPAPAATPEEAFAAGCGGCHRSDEYILRKIPRGTDESRRAWILHFMSGHPNESDAVNAEIVEYLLAKSAASRSWWQFR
jgi:mono/diheme cytochrome c family protein